MIDQLIKDGAVFMQQQKSTQETIYAKKAAKKGKKSVCCCCYLQGLIMVAWCRWFKVESFKRPPKLSLRDRETESEKKGEKKMEFLRALARVKFSAWAPRTRLRWQKNEQPIGIEEKKEASTVCTPFFFFSFFACKCKKKASAS